MKREINPSYKSSSCLQKTSVENSHYAISKHNLAASIVKYRLLMIMDIKGKILLELSTQF
jgi:hypothetical protein